MQVGDKIKLEARVGKQPTSANGTPLNLCRCWPMTAEGRKAMEAANVTEIQFNGSQKVFTVGTEITGNAVVTHVEDAKATQEDGSLGPRFKLDADGMPVSEGGKDVILQRISVRFVDGSYKRASSAEEVLKASA